MKRILALLIVVCTATVLTSFQPTAPKQLRIAVASNMQFMMKDMVETFGKHTNTKCELVVASSGKHCAQIMNGADVDVFVSASKVFTDKLEKANATVRNVRHVGSAPLVMWSTKLKQAPEQTTLSTDAVRKIAIANPKVAPFGARAAGCFKKLGVMSGIESKLVFAENVAQVNHLVMTGAVDVGITSRSSVLAPATRGKGVYTAMKCGAVDHYAVMVKQDDPKYALADNFIRFMGNSIGKRILIKHGYFPSQR